MNASLIDSTGYTYLHLLLKRHYTHTESLGQIFLQPCFMYSVKKVNDMLYQQREQH